MITVDMARAREVHRARLRAARAPLLAALDIEWMRAAERGDTAAQARIVQRKAALRDVTNAPEIEAATTPQELAAFDPFARG